jgi:hypothetical protein
LTTPRAIGGVNFDGSAAIVLPGVNSGGNQNTSGSAATLTTARSIGGVDFDGSAAIVPTTFNGATFDTDTLVVDATNNRVGIGTDSPQYRLDVGHGAGATAADDVMLRVMSSSSTSGKLIFGRSGTTDIRSHAIETYNSSGADNNYMKFLVHDGTGTAPYETRTEVMTLRGDGNVGIGTNAPVAKLQVDYTEGTLSNMNYSTTSSWHDKGLGLKGGQGGFIYGHDINHSIFLRQSPFGATDHNAYCNNGYHAFYTGGMIESQTEKMRIHANGNVDILSGDLDVVGSYKSDGKTVQRTLIGYQKYTSSTSVIYATGVTGYQNPWSVSYTRIHSGSEIYIIGDLCLAQALGAAGTTSYRGIYGRLKVYSGTVNYYSDSTYDWQRIDNSFHEYQRQSRVHFDQQALPETTAGQTMTIYAQVDEGGVSGTRTSWGLNIWAGRSFIEVFEVM